VIPEIVMDSLEMPNIFAGVDVNSDYGIGKQIVTGAIAAIGEG
jgi:hypothetical protein